jgi:hypothetical protein
MPFHIRDHFSQFIQNHPSLNALTHGGRQVADAEIAASGMPAGGGSRASIAFIRRHRDREQALRTIRNRGGHAAAVALAPIVPDASATPAADEAAATTVGPMVGIPATSPPTEYGGSVTGTSLFGDVIPVGGGSTPLPETETETDLEAEPAARSRPGRTPMFMIGASTSSSVGDGTSLPVTPYYTRKNTPGPTHVHTPIQGSATPIQHVNSALDLIADQLGDTFYSTRSGRRFPSVDSIPEPERETFLKEHDPMRRYGLTRDSMFYRAMEREWVTDDSRVFGYPDSIAMIHNHLAAMRNPAAAQYELDAYLQYLPILMPATELPEATRNVFWGRDESDALAATRSYLDRPGMVLVSVRLGDLMDAGYGVPFHDAVAMRNIPDRCVPLVVTWPGPDQEPVPVRIIEQYSATRA